MDIIKLIIEYDGTNYFGWQRQSNLRSVQGQVERTLKKLLKQDIEIDGAGRTDAGVHAFGQVATFAADLPMPVGRFIRAMNNFLPTDVRIVSAMKMGDDFHARYSASGKTYVYKVHNTLDRHAFLANYSYHYPYKIEDELIKKAIPYLIGCHDFTSFKASGSSAQNPIRTIHHIEFRRDGDELTFTFTGDGFLYKMIRILVGYLLEVGQGHVMPEKTEELLVKPSRKYTTKVAPANGLYLKEVYYNKEK